MPELPEVETIMRRLRDGTDETPPLPGQTIQKVTIFWDRIILTPDAMTFKQQIEGKTVVGAGRRGKFLHFPLSEGHLMGHLRMSGDMHLEYRLTPTGTPLPKGEYAQVLFDLESPYRLVFESVRKFGRMWVVSDPLTIFGDLGPEPLSKDLTPERLYQMLHTHHRQIKPLLMDQRFIAGLGNIYTDEVLFQARLHPQRRSDTLLRTDAEQLYAAIQDVLTMGIEKFGSSLDWIYRGGEFQNYFKIHQRKGEPCPECGETVQKITVGQRGTYLCPHCQPAPDKAG